MRHDTNYPTHADQDPGRIENDIEATRNRIEARLDALAGEFAPSSLMDRALGSNSADAEQDTFGLMVERARSNPLSAVLIAAGLAGMVLNRPPAQPTHASDDNDHYPVEPYSDDPAERIGHHLDTLGTQAEDVAGSARSAADSVSSAVSGAVDSVTGAVSSAKARLTATKDDVTNRANAAYYRTRHKAGRSAEEWRETAREAPVRAKAGADYAVDWVKENPVPAGLFALAAGATVASLFAANRVESPRSRAEAAEDLYEEAEREAREKAARRAAVATAAAREPKAKAKARKTAGKKTTAKSATRKSATKTTKAATARKTAKPKAAAKTKAVKAAMPKSSTIGSNVTRSTAVQGGATKSSA